MGGFARWVLCGCCVLSEWRGWGFIWHGNLYPTIIFSAMFSWWSARSSALTVIFVWRRWRAGILLSPSNRCVKGRVRGVLCVLIDRRFPLEILRILASRFRFSFQAFTTLASNLFYLHVPITVCTEVDWTSLVNLSIHSLAWCNVFTN